MKLTQLVGPELARQIKEAFEKGTIFTMPFQRFTGPVLLVGEHLLGSTGRPDRERDSICSPTGDLPMTKQENLGTLTFYEAEGGERLVVFSPAKEHYVSQCLSAGFVYRFGVGDFAVEFFDEGPRSIGASLYFDRTDPSTSWGQIYAEQGIPGIVGWNESARGIGHGKIALTNDSWTHLQQMLEAWIPAKS